MYKILTLLLLFSCGTNAGPLFDHLFIEGEPDKVKARSYAYLDQLYERSDMNIGECLLIVRDCHHHLWQGSQFEDDGSISFDNLLQSIVEMRERIIYAYQQKRIELEKQTIIEEFKSLLFNLKTATLLGEAAFQRSFYYDDGLPQLLHQLRREYDVYRSYTPQAVPESLEKAEDELIKKVFKEVQGNLKYLEKKLDKGKLKTYLDVFQKVLASDLPVLQNYPQHYKDQAEMLIVKVYGFQKTTIIDVKEVAAVFSEIENLITNVLNDIRLGLHREVDKLVDEFVAEAEGGASSAAAPPDFLESNDEHDGHTTRSWWQSLWGT